MLALTGGTRPAPSPLAMMELSPHQMQIIERLLEAGFRPIAISPYENALCMRKGECAAVLGPVQNGGIKLLALPSYLVAGNLSVRLKRGAGEVFVWKKNELEVTAQNLSELDAFRRELNAILEPAPKH